MNKPLTPFRALLIGSHFMNDGHVWVKTDEGRAKPHGAPGPSYVILASTHVQVVGHMPRAILRRVATPDLATGGSRARTAAELLHLEPGDSLFGVVGSGTMSHVLDAGGPLDAPDVMPAGSVDSRTFHNGQGLALVSPTEVRRQS